MFVRSVLSSYSRLLAGASLALMAAALAGCNDTVAEKAEPPRPVLVATAHYDAETPERSFVGTIKPRIESDWSNAGFDGQAFACRLASIVPESSFKSPTGLFPSAFAFLRTPSRNRMFQRRG